MKINIKTPKEQPLCTLNAGDCFEHMGEYYIVTSERLVPARELDCVNLDTGEVECFTYEARVFKLDTYIALRRLGDET